MTSKLSKLKGGWRFLVVVMMVCTLASALMVTTAATPVAAATSITVTVSPDIMDMASTNCATVSVKNNAVTGSKSIKTVVLTLPANFSVASIPATTGWTVQSNTSNTVTWVASSSGNYIAVGATKIFNVCVNAPQCEWGSGYSFLVQTTDLSNQTTSNCDTVEVHDCPPAFLPEPLPCTSTSTPTICTQITHCNNKLDASSPTLYWSNDSGETWKNISLTQDTCTGLWCATIDITGTPDCTTIWYYFYAKDCAGYSAYSPAEAEGSPKTNHYSFKYTSATGPTINQFIMTAPAEKPDCFAGGSTVNVSWNVSAVCCPAEDITVDILFMNDSNIQKCLSQQLTSTNVSGYAVGNATVTLPMVNLNGSYLKLVAHDCCGCNDSDTAHYIQLPCIQSSLTMFDAITGWHWVGAGHTGSYSDRYSIMVTFNKELDPATVSASDFQVTNPTATITSIELHNNVGNGNSNGNWSVVFLNLAAPLATDATPTVKLVGNVSTLGYTGACQAVSCETLPNASVISEDGIAPMLTLSTTPANPTYNQVVTVTMTSTETLSEYCYNLCGLDKSDNVRVWVSSDYGPDSSVIMTPNPTSNGKVWTGTFVNTIPSDYEWRVEAEACQCLNPCDLWPWKVPQCAEASLIFDGFDFVQIHVCEGWNLISVSDTLLEPSISKAFSRFTSENHYGPVTKVCYFTGGTSGTWQASVLNPVTGLWTGTITTIDPGKAYWVWCDDGGLDLMMRLAPRSPVASVPSIPLQAGWNMVGIWDITHAFNDNLDVCFYFGSILTYEKNPTLWAYSCQRGWDGANLNTDHCDYDLHYGQGYWVSVNQAQPLYPITMGGQH